MRLLLVWLAMFWLLPEFSFSQPTYSLSGTVTSSQDEPLPGANVRLVDSNRLTITDGDGRFAISGLVEGMYTLEVSFLGYQTFAKTLVMDASRHIDIKLKRSVQTLQEVVVTDSYAETRKRQDARSIEVVNEAFLRQNLSGSLMTSLERLPGVSAIDIGSGQSKPVIRGLSFNRVVVSENGVKHEAQQWGTDHGLEIDQYAVDRAEVIKGPSSLAYGSDAIGGIIEIKHVQPPVEESVGGSLDLTGKSNNGFLGSSAMAYVRGKKLFFTSRYTHADYADFRVPADSVDIYSYRAPLHKNRLRNTAGQERNVHLSAGYANNRFTNRLFLSNLSSKNGFFANTHGLEPRNIDTDTHDHSNRDILYPYHEVNHLKVINKTEWRAGKVRGEANLGYQHNLRQEWSEYVNHGYMPGVFPEGMPFPGDLEREFDKHIFSGNVNTGISFSENWRFAFGLDAQYQKNAINGRGFIIPAFQQLHAGSFAYGRFMFASNSFLHAGIRYDLGSIHTERYSDWFVTPVTMPDQDTVQVHLNRAPELNRKFNQFTWSVGVNHNLEKLSLKANLGKSFRMPIAKELAANGVNYHRFSYEIGDSTLSPEISYQFDAGMELNTERFAIGISPFVNYFANYIYLNPDYRHDRRYGNGNQIFYYTQSEVLRLGGEIHAHYNVIKPLHLGFILEYVYSEQLSGDKKGFTLPFSPPASALFNLKYTRQKAWLLRNSYLSVDYNLVARQHLIVPPEKKTPGYQRVDVSAGGDIQLLGQQVSMRFQVQNLFNIKYFNHTSYYRLINVPGAGRNFILNISIPFHQKLKNNS